MDNIDAGVTIVDTPNVIPENTDNNNDNKENETPFTSLFRRPSYDLFNSRSNSQIGDYVSENRPYFPSDFDFISTFGLQNQSGMPFGTSMRDTEEGAEQVKPKPKPRTKSRPKKVEILNVPPIPIDITNIYKAISELKTDADSKIHALQHVNQNLFGLSSVLNEKFQNFLASFIENNSRKVGDTVKKALNAKLPAGSFFCNSCDSWWAVKPTNKWNTPNPKCSECDFHYKMLTEKRPNYTS